MENKKIMEYYIIVEYSQFDACDSVNKLISAGWQPFGGISAKEGEFIQAMVKYEKEKEIVIKNSMRIIDDDGLIVETDKVII